MTQQSGNKKEGKNVNDLKVCTALEKLHMLRAAKNMPCTSNTPCFTGFCAKTTCWNEPPRSSHSSSACLNQRESFLGSLSGQRRPK